MDPRSLPIYQHPRVSMMAQPHISSVPGSIPVPGSAPVTGSIPINAQMSIPAHAAIGMPGEPMLDSHATFTHKTHANKISAQQHYSQLPLRKEVDDEGRICGVVLPQTPAQLPTEGNNYGDGEDSNEQVKSDEEEFVGFMEAAYDIFLKVSSKEMTLKAASEKLGRPYSFVYSRFQEFCDKITGKDDPEKKKAPIIKKNGRKKRKPKKLTITKGKPRRGKIFKCEECPATFYSAYLIKAHSKVHEGDTESHICTACGVVFPKLIKLMRHRIEFHQEALQCPHCDSQFTIVASYRYHIRAHSGVKPFVCNECGKGFYSRFTLQHHHRLHTGEKPYMCGYCEKSFIALNNLKAHMFVHTGDRERNHECEVCGQKYQYRASLREHMNIHTGAKPYGCDLCEERFNFKANLARHKMTHTGEQPYACDLCPATFYVPIDLKRHKISHTGLKPYKCEQCDYACTRKSNLEFHNYTHTGETPFKCDFYGCTAEYSRPKSLKKHKLLHGPPPPQTCKYCNEKFIDSISLKRHMMLHTGEKPHTCEQCFKTCIDKAALKRHMYKHMYKPPGQKIKQVRQSKKNPPVKKIIPSVPVVITRPTEYQIPMVAENGHGSISQSWTINAEDTTTSSQPSFHPFTASQYTNLVSNAWPTTMDPDELRRRLLNSFK